MDPKLFVPILDHHCLPDKLRIFLRFGVPEIENNDEWRGELTQKDEESCFPASDDYWDVTTKTVTTQQIQWFETKVIDTKPFKFALPAFPLGTVAWQP